MKYNAFLKKTLLSCITFLSLSASLFAQVPEIEWWREYGGTEADGNPPDFYYSNMHYGAMLDILTTNDGGSIFICSTLSQDGDVQGNPVTTNPLSIMWLVKLSANGSIEWQKSYPTYVQYGVASMVENSDGTYTLVAGGHYQSDNTHLIKIDAMGTIIWNQTYTNNGLGDKLAYKLIKTNDGGYAFIGEEQHAPAFIANMWVVKTNASGGIEWQRSIGGTQEDFGYAICQTADGSIYCAGNPLSADGDIGTSTQQSQYWITKLNPVNGTTVWQKFYGKAVPTNGGINYVRALLPMPDNGIIVAGSMDGNDGDITDNHGNRDAWVIRINDIGTLLWAKSYGGSEHDERAEALFLSNDGNVFVTGVEGSSLSNNTNSNLNCTDDKTWVAKLNANTGSAIWIKCLDETPMRITSCIKESFDGHIWVAGISAYTGCHGNRSSDICIVKLGLHPPVPPRIDGVTTLSCFTQNTTLMAVQDNPSPTPVVSYLWSTGETTPSITATPPTVGGVGIYTVTITYENNCTKSVEVTVTRTGVLDIAPNITPALCTTASGSIAPVATGGLAPYTYTCATCPTAFTNGAFNNLSATSGTGTNYLIV